MLRQDKQHLARCSFFNADTVFVRAQRGEFDAVVTMYHDQGQIAMKLMGFDHGVTVLGGLPVPVTTPAHGTAFDIAGKGKANPDALKAAWKVCLLYTSPSPRDQRGSRMPSSA